jgi:ankyrin repeat protein
MRLTKSFLICAGFLFVIIFLSFAAAKAQTAVSYQFLEVIDSNGKPVADATVETLGFRAERSFKTDEKGQIEKIEVYYGDYTTTGFAISKTGFYPFRYEFEEGYSTRVPLRIELLKIPQTKDERALIENEQRKREFFAAVRKADTEAVRKFLKMGLSVNLSSADLRGVPFEKNVPIIIYAARTGDSQIVNEFLKAGVDVRKIPDILLTYLSAPTYALFSPASDPGRKARLEAYEDTAESLIKAGADVRALGKYGETTLMFPAQKGLIRTAKLLIEKGVPVNAATGDYLYSGMSSTALTRVITNNEDKKSRFEMADLLLKSGADINLAPYGTPTWKWSNIYCRTARTLIQPAKTATQP